MLNRCIGCYYYKNKENVCTLGSPIFIDDNCIDYQDSEFVEQIRTDAIDDFANWLVEQGILGSRCISDGEITDYGRVYAKKYKEQLKEQ